MNFKKYPKKPTTPFGHITFPKKGRVIRKITKLSEFKPIQEKEVIEIFAGQYNQIYSDNPINEIMPLPENDHDFTAEINGKKTIIQLTELAGYEYQIRLTNEQYKQNSGKWSNFINVPGEEIPRAIDTIKKDSSLEKLIQKKIEKNYSKESRDIWLVIFTTDVFYLIEYIENRKLIQSEALKRAVNYLTSIKQIPFKEIWVTNLQTKPKKIW